MKQTPFFHINYYCMKITSYMFMKQDKLNLYLRSGIYISCMENFILNGS